MTNKLVIIINSLKVPKIKKILLYEMKFLVPNYSCLQNPWLGGYRPQIPVLCVLCPQLNLLNPPPTEQNSWVRHCQTVLLTGWSTMLGNQRVGCVPQRDHQSWGIDRYRSKGKASGRDGTGGASRPRWPTDGAVSADPQEAKVADFVGEKRARRNVYNSILTNHVVNTKGLQW